MRTAVICSLKGQMEADARQRIQHTHTHTRVIFQEKKKKKKVRFRVLKSLDSGSFKGNPDDYEDI